LIRVPSREESEERGEDDNVSQEMSKPVEILGKRLWSGLKMSIARSR